MFTLFPSRVLFCCALGRLGRLGGGGGEGLRSLRIKQKALLCGIILLHTDTCPPPHLSYSEKHLCHTHPHHTLTLK